MTVEFFFNKTSPSDDDFFIDCRMDDVISVDDFLREFDAFCAEKTASCYGCVGCCQERVPVTYIDATTLLKILPPTEQALSSLCEKYLEIKKLPDGAYDITLRRSPSGSCIFIDSDNNCCSIHKYRPFACGSHHCLPRGSQINAIRSEIINQGMDELIRVMQQENILGNINPEDYPENIFTGQNSYKKIVVNTQK